MKEPEYKRDGITIVRISDGKIVANIENDKIIPVAPAYYKETTFKKIKSACDGEAVSEPDHIETKAVVLRSFKDILIPHNHPQIEHAGAELKALYESMEGMKSKQVWDTIGRTALGMTLPTEEDLVVHLPTGGPEMDATLGNRTPGYPTWLHSVNPAEAAKRFSSGYSDEYNDLMKNLKPTE
tara:strand:+ start:543 stop:1088 length:546 start_codon:yes stop_codon:yes gene_type:complete